MRQAVGIHRLEGATMNEVLPHIQSFLSGALSPDSFRDHLYSHPEYEAFLNNDPHLRSDNYVKGSVYRYLLELDLSNYSDVINAQGALADFLARNQIEHQVSEKYRQFADLIVTAQPAWLDVPTEYVAEKMLPAAGGLEGMDLHAWLTREFRARFRCAGKPPNWIQSPNWPINQNGPLVFLGQCKISGYFHDDAAAYVFHDPVTGRCETVIQVG